MTMAQKPETARHDAIAAQRDRHRHGGPRVARRGDAGQARGVRDVSCARRGRGRATLLGAVGNQLARICTLLRRTTGHDFSRYKTGTLVRRIQRRMQVLQMARSTAYLERLRQEPREVESLFRDLLIGVTHFFRDPEAFEVLAREVDPPHRAGRPDRTGRSASGRPAAPPARRRTRWPSCCAKQMRRQDAAPRVQIFAGDIDDEALDVARARPLPRGIAERHLARAAASASSRTRTTPTVVNKEIREMCIFSTHNLIKDPPFSRLDLIVCRNLLIYLETDLQEHTIAAVPLRAAAGRVPLPRALREHRRADRTCSAPSTRSTASSSAPTPDPPPIVLASAGRVASREDAGRANWTPRAAAPGSRGRGRAGAAADRQYAPAWVVVNAQGDVLYFSPRTGRYLEPAAGAPTLDILSMARKGLRLDLRTALHQAAKTRRDRSIHENVLVETDGDVQRVNLIVRPLAELGDGPRSLHGRLPGARVRRDRAGRPSARRRRGATTRSSSSSRASCA